MCFGMEGYQTDGIVRYPPGFLRNFYHKESFMNIFCLYMRGIIMTICN